MGQKYKIFPFLQSFFASKNFHKISKNRINSLTNRHLPKISNMPFTGLFSF